MLSLGAAIAALLWLPAGAAEIELGYVHYMPVDPGFDRKVPARGEITDNRIQYHGGPVMGTNPDFSNTPNIYFTWYGNWTGDTALDILPDFASNLGGSPYFNINTSYTDGAGNPVINLANFGVSSFDSYSQGSVLNLSRVATIVANAIGRGDLPLDINGVYFVLTSADVTEGQFCSSYCGWHTWMIYQSTPIKFSWVGNPQRCLNACAPPGNRTTSPNGNPGADGMANIIGHEFEESVTDPQLNAWWQNGTGQENADLCAWTFGTTWTEPNGSRANMTLGTRDYLIQQNWVNDLGGYCDLSY